MTAHYDRSAITFTVEGNTIGHEIHKPEYLKYEFRGGARDEVFAVLGDPFRINEWITDFKVRYEVIRAMDYLLYIRPKC